MKNKNAVVVYYDDNFHTKGKIDIKAVFTTEEKAKKFIDDAVIEWLKNQKTFDPEHKFSGEVRYGNDIDEPYVYLDWNRKDDPTHYSWFDYVIYDLE